MSAPTLAAVAADEPRRALGTGDRVVVDAYALGQATDQPGEITTCRFLATSWHYTVRLDNGQVAEDVPARYLCPESDPEPAKPWDAYTDMADEIRRLRAELEAVTVERDRMRRQLVVAASIGRDLLDAVTDTTVDGA